MRSIIRRPICLLLALVLVLGLLSGLRLPAEAAGVAINSSNFPDANFRSFVKQYDANSDNSLSSAELAAVKEMACNGKSIASLKGIEYFTSLTFLNCNGNQISSVDLSKLTALENFWCYQNKLSALDLSKLSKLTVLYCADNQLSALDVSKLSKLRELNCNKNRLSVLDVSANSALRTLSCEQNRLTSVDVSHNAKLIELCCGWNEIPTVDVSRNPELTKLYCIENELTALDLTKNTKLEYLYCSGNRISSLDLSKNKALQQLLCYSCQLGRLDLSANTALEYVNCSYNTPYLAELVLGNNEVLKKLFVNGNARLEGLDISGTPKVRYTVQHGTLESNSDGTDLYSSGSDCLVKVDHGLELFLEKTYLLKICGNWVTEANRADILGDGAFVFDGARMLTVKGDCTNSKPIIENVGIKGLRIRVLGDVSLLSTGDNCILAKSDTRITGPKKLTMKNTYALGSGISTNVVGVTVSLEEANLIFSGRYGIHGAALPNDTRLILDHSNLSVGECRGGAIYDFGGGITLRNLQIFQPSSGRLNDGKNAIVNSNNRTADYVMLQPDRWTNPFNDLPSGKYYRTPALWAYHHEPQITSGATTSTFGPAKECKREQVMTFLWKAAGAPEPVTDSCPFTDVPKSKYYYKPILWAVENGITGGVSATKFGVGKACTRAQVVTFLWKFAGAPEPIRTDCPFTDVSKTKYYYKPVLWALENGITSGTSSTAFGVSKTCTRGQVVTFLYKLMVG